MMLVGWYCFTQCYRRRDITGGGFATGTAPPTRPYTRARECRPQKRTRSFIAASAKNQGKSSPAHALFPRADMILMSPVSLSRPLPMFARTLAVSNRAHLHGKHGDVVTCALGKGKNKRPPKGPPKGQGDLEKKRCDLCLGTGIRKCYGCHVAEGWRADNFSTSKCERAGYVPIKIGGFLGFGGEPWEEKCGVCWNDPAKKPGTVQCIRCKGTKYIYFRNADWR